MDIKTLSERVIAFRDARDWKQYHTVKDMFLSLGLEVSELGELFQWKTEEEIAEVDRERIGEELSDILYWVLLLANDLGVDLEEAFQHKMAKNDAKYPIEKALGKSEKYTQL